MSAANSLLNFLKGSAGGVPAASPTETPLGVTPEQPDPGLVRPRLGMTPFGASGRANFYGLPQPDEMNQQLVGQTGLRTFDTMYRTDADIRRLILMCWSPIQAATVSLDPYGADEASDEDRMVAETVWWLLTRFMSPTLPEHLSAVGPLLLRSGFLPFEQIWAPVTHEGKQFVAPRKLDVRLPRSIWRWWQDENGELTHVGQILPNKPDVVIPVSELVYYRLAPEGDNWVGTSLLRHAYKNWYLKDKLERIDAVGQERSAVGVPLIFPPKNATPQQREEVETLFASMHLSEVAYGMLPGPSAKSAKGEYEADAWDVDIVQFDSSSSGIQESLKFHRDGIASSFLGDFMQLGHHQVGARATAQVQQDPFNGAVEALVESTIKPPLQKLIDRIVHLNWGEDQGTPTLRFQLTDAASLSELAEYVSDLVTAGAMVADPELEDWLRERADLPPVDADVRAEEEEKRKAQNEASIERAKEPPQPPPVFGQPAAVGQPAKGGPQGKAQAGGKPAKPESKPAKPGKAGKMLAASEPTVKWWETLLSQDRLGEAFQRVREHVEAAALPAAATLARKMAASQTAGHTPTPDLEQLTAAFETHYRDLYLLGRETVQVELAKQRRALKRLDEEEGEPEETAPRQARTRERANHSAELVAAAVGATLTKQAINGQAGTLEATAVVAAERAVHAQAMESAPAQIADGRADTAAVNPDVVGAYYTAVMDSNTCDECDAADSSVMLSLEEAEGLVPNPLCEGGPRCRCQLIYVLSEDPAALGLIAGAV